MSGGRGAGTFCPPSGPDTASGWPLESRLEFGPLSGAVPCARLHIRHVLREWQQADLIETAELIVSELMTNAITATQAIHSVCPIRLWIQSDNSQALIIVGDSSPHPPRRLDPAGDTEGGRGLVLVEALSNRWGWYVLRQRGTAKVVWAELGEGSAGMSNAPLGGAQASGGMPCRG